MDEEDAVLIRLLSIHPRNRSPEEIALIHTRLRTIECLCNLHSSHRQDSELYQISCIAKYYRAPGDLLLYRVGEPANSWYVLLTGSVLIDSSMFLPRACFGIRQSGSLYHHNDCLVLEPSDLIVIDYSVDEDVSKKAPPTGTHHHTVTQCNRRRHSFGLTTTVPNSSDPRNYSMRIDATNLNPSQLSRNNPIVVGATDNSNCKNAKSTNTSVETRPTPMSSMLNNQVGRSAAANNNADNKALPNTVKAVSQPSNCANGDLSSNEDVCFEEPDNDGDADDDAIDEVDDDDDTNDEEDEDDDDTESRSHESIRDAFLESILKEPAERTAKDIQLIMENVQQLPAFSNLTKATCYSLCGVMMLAIVHEAGQIVLTENENLDTWSVILNGTVEVIEPDGTVRELTRGDSFGVRPGAKADKPTLHKGTMHTVMEDCHFACVSQADYLRIMSKEGEAEIPELEEGGRVVLVYETVNLDNSGTTNNMNDNDANKTVDNPIQQNGRVVTKGTPEKLIDHLVADLSNVDITYPEDFLLTYRTFLPSPRPVVSRLLFWHLQNPSLRKRVNRIILLWVHNHFNDFEDSSVMMRFIEQFDNLLASDGTAGELRLLRLACSTKARLRQIELYLPLKSRPTDSAQQHDKNQSEISDLPFVLIGGDAGFGVFVHQVNATPTNDGDQLLDDLLTSTKMPDFNYDCRHNEPSNDLEAGTGLGGQPSSIQLRRGDQLLAVNGRAIDHLKSFEIVHLIQTICDTYYTNCNDNNSSSTASINPNLATPCDASTIAVVGPGQGICVIRLLVIFNPVQYYQLLSTLNSNDHLCDMSKCNLNTAITSHDKKEGNQCTKWANHLMAKPTHANIADIIIRAKKQSLPTSVSIPYDLVTTMNSPNEDQSHSDTPTFSINGKTPLILNSNNHCSTPCSSQLTATSRMIKTTNSANNSPTRRPQSVERKSIDYNRPVSGQLDPLNNNTDGHHQCKMTKSKESKRSHHSKKQEKPDIVNDNKSSLTPDKQCANSTSRNTIPHRSSSQPDLNKLPELIKNNHCDNGKSSHAHMITTNISNNNSSNFVQYKNAPVFGNVVNHTGHELFTPNVLRIWRASDNGRDQTSKLILLPRPQATALEVIRLALEEYGLMYHDETNQVDCYSLIHVIVEPGPIIKQSRLANNTDDLPGRLTLNSRYYLKCTPNHETLIADDVAKQILTNSHITFSQLPPEQLAICLTLDDYEVFRCVQSTEYIDGVFDLQTSDHGFSMGHSNLDRFTQLVNREAYWAPTEICNETNLNRRVDLLKRFIKLTKLCRDLRNYNTMFCLLVGLHQASVERLKQTWDRLPNKYHKIYQDLSMILDTSRNFQHYRNLLTSTSGNVSAPTLPYLPLALKDLTFINLGNPSRTADGLINFVKLRMIAKEVRAISRMCNVDYDPNTIIQNLSPRTRRRVGGRSRAHFYFGAQSKKNIVAYNNSSSVKLSRLGFKPYWQNNSTSSHSFTSTESVQQNSMRDSIQRASTTQFESDNENSVPSTYQRSLSIETTQSTTIGSVGSWHSITTEAQMNHASFSSNSSFGALQAMVSQSVGNPNILNPFSQFNNSAATCTTTTTTTAAASGSSNNSRELKKFHEQWLMNLRIRTYMANLHVIEDIDVLNQLSNRNEPATHHKESIKTSNTSTPTVNTSPQSNATETVADCKSVEVAASAPNVSSTSSTHNATTDAAANITDTKASSTNISPSLHPVLGVQSAEEARKLLILSERNKRSSSAAPLSTQKRLPSFTFPNHNPVFMNHPPICSTPGIGPGQLHTQAVWSANPNDVSPVTQNILHSNMTTTMTGNAPLRCLSSTFGVAPLTSPGAASSPIPVTYNPGVAKLGYKTFVLDNLIPMPSRISSFGHITHPPHSLLNNNNRHYNRLQNHNQLMNSRYQQIYSMLAQRSSLTKSMKQHYAGQSLSNDTHHHQHQQQQQAQRNRLQHQHNLLNYSNCQQQQRKSNHCLFDNSVAMTRGCSQVGNSTTSPLTTFQRQSSVPSNQITRDPSHIIVKTSSVTDSHYHYPTANVNPLSLVAGAQRDLRHTDPPFCWQSKPTQPPPYEIALALRQSTHPSTMTPTSLGPIELLMKSSSSTRNNNNFHHHHHHQAEQQQHHKAMTTTPPTLLSQQHQQSRQPSKSNGIPKQIISIGQTHSVTRPSPPSYQQVVSMPRQNSNSNAHGSLKILSTQPHANVHTSSVPNSKRSQPLTDATTCQHRHHHPSVTVVGVHLGFTARPTQSLSSSSNTFETTVSKLYQNSNDPQRQQHQNKRTSPPEQHKPRRQLAK